MSRAPSSRQRVVVAALALAAYVSLAFGVEDAFPFYRFDMFSWPMRTPVGRVMAQTADGEVRPVEDFVDWACERPPAEAVLGPAVGCPDHVRGDRFERQALRHLATHPARSPEAVQDAPAVQLVRRVIGVSERGRPQVLACALASCVARPVESR